MLSEIGCVCNLERPVFNSRGWDGLDRIGINSDKPDSFYLTIVPCIVKFMLRVVREVSWDFL